MDKTAIAAEVKKAKKGDRAAFEALYEEYRDKLYFFVLKNVKNKEAAEDITQETFLLSMEKISRLKNEENYGAWLHRIAYNKCRDLFRDEKRNAYFESEEERETAMENVRLNEPITLPEDYAANKEIKKQLKKAIDSLKPDMRSAVILYYYDDLGIKEVAEVLGISENAAKQKLFRARKKLRDSVDKCAPKDTAMCGVPIGLLLSETVTPKYAAAGSSGTAVGSAVMPLKIAGAALGSVAVLGAAVGIGIMKNGGGYFGDRRADASSVSSSAVISSSAADRVSSHGETSHAPDTESKTAALPEEKYPVFSEQSSGGEASGTSAASSYEESESGGESSSSPEDTRPLVERLLSMTVEEALEMGGSDFDTRYARGDYVSDQTVYVCTAFPNFGFSSGTEGGGIDFLNLYDGAFISENIYVGMTYNEIAERIGGITNFGLTGDDLYLSCWANIDGRLWEIGFELNNEQENEIIQRLYSKDPEAYEENPFSVSADISDINPVSNIAVYDTDRQLPEYVGGRG